MLLYYQHLVLGLKKQILILNNLFVFTRKDVGFPSDLFSSKFPAIILYFLSSPCVLLVPVILYSLLYNLSALCLHASSMYLPFCMGVKLFTVYWRYRDTLSNGLVYPFCGNHDLISCKNLPYKYQQLYC